MATASAIEFTALCQQQSLTVIDLRTHVEHHEERLEKSILLPVQELSEERLEESLALHGEDPDVLYLLCRSGKRADAAVEKLGDYKRKLVVIEGGLNELKACGMKTFASDKKVISLERQVRIAAGVLVLIGTVLSLVIHPAFIGLAMFVGAGLTFAGITDWCGMGLLLARMPWNKA